MNSRKNHTNNNLMCGVRDNQATKTKCIEVIITNKSRKQQREKERENTEEFVYLIRSKLT